MATQLQLDFSGGMNLLSLPGENQYGTAFNIRTRERGVQCVKEPTLDTSLPAGKKQGIVAYENILVAFVAGRAYYKNLAGSDDWTQIQNFVMSVTAEYIYVEAVPTSFFNYERKLQENTRIDGSSTETNVNITSLIISNSEAGLVCQDGFTQPYIILSDGTCRKLKTYEQWTMADREYVPRGTLMKYHAGILHVLAPNGIDIYRSVTGRPLDFVVNITKTGDKGGAAHTTAINAGVGNVTCLSKLRSGELFVATRLSCHPMELNYDKTIFSEPTYLNRKPFAAGVLNQFSFLDIITDYVMIDLDGLRSINAIIIEDNEGRNSLFSLNLSRALEGVVQSTVAAAVFFDNYAMFSINTIHGQVVAVYDTRFGTWVCFDSFGIGTIKQFAVAKQSAAPVLYAITDNNLYSLYTEDTSAQAQLKTRHIMDEPRLGVELSGAYVNFDAPTEDDSVSITHIVDNTERSTIELNLTGDGEQEPLFFNFSHKRVTGRKVQVNLTWQNDGILTDYQLMYDTNQAYVPTKQTVKSYANR